MRKAIRNLFIITLVIISSVNSFADQTTVAYKPDGWQGLALDQSSPEDAIKILGQASEDKLDRLHVRNLDKWLSPKQEQKVFRVLTYKPTGEVKKVELDFIDNKLVRIHLEY
jgi:hypothetical protein